MVSIAQVTLAMQPWLGMSLLNVSPLAEGLVFRVNAFRLSDDPDGLSRALDSLLFTTVRQIAGADMRVLLDDGTWIRVRTEDFSVMADELMYFYFMTYPVEEKYLRMLNAYAVTHQSLSALRVLYTRFAALHTPNELAAIARIARGSYPAFRLGWLASQEERGFDLG